MLLDTGNISDTMVANIVMVSIIATPESNNFTVHNYKSRQSSRHFTIDLLKFVAHVKWSRISATLAIHMKCVVHVEWSMKRKCASKFLVIKLTSRQKSLDSTTDL